MNPAGSFRENFKREANAQPRISEERLGVPTLVGNERQDLLYVGEGAPPMSLCRRQVSKKPSAQSFCPLPTERPEIPPCAMEPKTWGSDCVSPPKGRDQDEM